MNRSRFASTNIMRCQIVVCTLRLVVEGRVCRISTHDHRYTALIANNRYQHLINTDKPITDTDIRYRKGGKFDGQRDGNTFSFIICGNYRLWRNLFALHEKLLCLVYFSHSILFFHSSTHLNSICPLQFLVVLENKLTSNYEKNVLQLPIFF
jgi:hypothetical protein